MWHIPEEEAIENQRLSREHHYHYINSSHRELHWYETRWYSSEDSPPLEEHDPNQQDVDVVVHVYEYRHLRQTPESSLPSTLSVTSSSSSSSSSFIVNEDNDDNDDIDNNYDDNDDDGEELTFHDATHNDDDGEEWIFHDATPTTITSLK